MQFAYMPLYYAVVGGLQRVVGDHGYTVGRARLAGGDAAAGQRRWPGACSA